MKKRYCLIFIFLCAPFLTKASKLSEDSLIIVNNYYETLIECEYVIYKSNNIDTINAARYKKAICYKHLGNYSKATLEIERINFSVLSDYLSPTYQYEAALCAYLSGDFNTSLFHIEQIKTRNKDILNCSEIALLQALNFNRLYQWEKAHKAAIEYSSIKFKGHQFNSIIKQIDSLYQSKNTPKIKSKKRLSYYKFIPGLGQIYAGYYKEGIFNFILNASALIIGTYEVYKSFYFTGYCLGAIPISKFYFGSQARAELLLDKHNYFEISEFDNKVKAILIK